MSVLAKLASLVCLGFFKSIFTLSGFNIIASFDNFLYFINSDACLTFSLFFSLPLNLFVLSFFLDELLPLLDTKSES